MSLLPKTHSEFTQKDYWDSFFQKRTKAFEWYVHIKFVKSTFSVIFFKVWRIS